MTKIEKIWFDTGYNSNHCGEHPEAICQERWLSFIEFGRDVPTLVKYFPFYKQGVTKAFNEKNK